MKRCLSCATPFSSQDWQCPSCRFIPAVHNGIYSFAPDLSGHDDDYDPSRYDTIKLFQQQHFWFRGRNELICAQLKKHFSSSVSILEIGCGTGQVLNAINSAFPAMHLCGTEIHTQGLELARHDLPNAEFLQIDARAIPFEEEFDVVCAFDVIEHIEEDCTALTQLHQACRPGGGVILTVPQHDWLWSKRDELAHHKRRYSRHDLLKKLRDVGFVTQEATSFITFLLPLMFLSRLRQRNDASTEENSEFQLSPTANRVFLTLSRCENWLISRGIRLPIGGSLLVIAKKPL